MVGLNPPRARSKRRLNAIVVVQMMVAMQDDSYTMHELVELTGLGLQTVRSYVLTLHREGGCYITHFEPDKRNRFVTPSFKLGRKKDAPQPRTSNAERHRRHRERRRMQDTLHAMAGPSKPARAKKSRAGRTPA